MTPRPAPAANAAGRLDMRATTAQVKARSSSDGPNEAPVVKPCVGWVRIAVRPARAPAMAHANELIRLAKMPAIRAASGLAAEVRKARPHRLNLRNSASATTTIG